MLKDGLSASMMCVDFGDTRTYLRQLEKASVEYMHFDIMDGDFVSNYALGPCVVNSIRKETDLGVDIHMMVWNPEHKLSYFELREGDAVSVHAESTPHMQRVLAELKQKGVLAGAALNPSTPVETLRYVLDMLDYVLVMTVNPGFAGQKMVPATLDKITDVRQYLDAHGYQRIKIQVDGNVSVENAVKMQKAGADNFVCGTAGLFRKDRGIVEAAECMRSALGMRS